MLVSTPGQLCELYTYHNFCHNLAKKRKAAKNGKPPKKRLKIDNDDGDQNKPDEDEDEKSSSMGSDNDNEEVAVFLKDLDAVSKRSCDYSGGGSVLRSGPVQFFDPFMGRP